MILRLMAGDPRDHLAALGLMRLLRDDGQASAALAWEGLDRHDARAIVSGVTVDEILSALRADLDVWTRSPLRHRAIADWPITGPTRSPSREETQALALLIRDVYRGPPWGSGAAPQGDIVVTQFDFAAGQSTMQRWLDSTLDHISPSLVLDELMGLQSHAPAAKDLRWQGRGPYLSALGPRWHATAGIDYLAWRGLSLRPLYLGADETWRGATQNGAEMDRNGHMVAFSWPVWTTPARWQAVRNLLVSLPPVWRSKVVRLGPGNPYRAFAPAQWVYVEADS